MTPSIFAGVVTGLIIMREHWKPILAISLELYDDATKTANSTVLRKQSALIRQAALLYTASLLLRIEQPQLSGDHHIQVSVVGPSFNRR